MTTIMLPITPREIEILHLVSQEYSSKEIARQLFISPNTVYTHRENLMVKLGARNSAGLVRRGFELGVLQVNADCQIMKIGK